MAYSRNIFALQNFVVYFKCLMDTSSFSDLTCELHFMHENQTLKFIRECFQEKFEAEEERLRRAKHTSEENIENEIRKKAEKSQQKMEKYKENHEAQLEARLEKLRAEKQHREEVRLKRSERKTQGTSQG